MPDLSVNPAERAAVRTLDNGLTLAVERIDGVKSVGVTMRLPVGVASDPADLVGASVINAEWIMRGSGSHDARSAANAIDRLGASINTDAGSRHTTVSGTVIGRNILPLLDLFAGIIRQPCFEPAHFDASRELAAQAIASLEDEPQERVFHLLRRVFHPAPFDRSTEGELEGVRAATAESCQTRWRDGARPRGSFLAIAGDVEPDAVMSHVEHLFSDWTGDGVTPGYDTSAAPKPGHHHESDDTDQVHIALAVPAPREDDPHAPHERLLNTVMSGGMGARLFTEVREKRGLVYSVHSSYHGERDFGMISAYAGTTPPRARETMDLVTAELNRIRTADGLPTDEEIARARIGLKSKMVMSGESTSARASALARDLWTRGHVLTLDERLARLDAVGNDELRQYAEAHPLEEPRVMTLGPEMG